MLNEDAYALSQHNVRFSFIDHLILNRLERSERLLVNTNDPAEIESRKAHVPCEAPMQQSVPCGAISTANDCGSDIPAQPIRFSLDVKQKNAIRNRRKKEVATVPVHEDNQEDSQREAEALRAVKEAVDLAQKRARKHQKISSRRRREEQRKRRNEIKRMQEQLKVIDSVRYNRSESTNGTASQDYERNERSKQIRSSTDVDRSITAEYKHDDKEIIKVSSLADNVKNASHPNVFDTMRRQLLENFRLRTHITANITSKLELLTGKYKVIQKRLKQKQKDIDQRTISVQDLEKQLKRAEDEAAALEKSVQHKRLDRRELEAQVRYAHNFTQKSMTCVLNAEETNPQAFTWKSQGQGKIAAIVKKAKDRFCTRDISKNQLTLVHQKIALSACGAKSEETTTTCKRNSLSRSNSWNCNSIRDFMHTEAALVDSRIPTTSGCTSKERFIWDIGSFSSYADYEHALTDFYNTCTDIGPCLT